MSEIDVSNIGIQIKFESDGDWKNVNLMNIIVSEGGVLEIYYTNLEGELDSYKVSYFDLLAEKGHIRFYDK